MIIEVIDYEKKKKNQPILTSLHFWYYYKAFKGLVCMVIIP
jgi:hypothetical protein